MRPANNTTMRLKFDVNSEVVPDLPIFEQGLLEEVLVLESRVSSLQMRL